MAILWKKLVSNVDRDSQKKFYDRLKEMPPGEYEIFVCDKKFTRSHNQNAYYWAVVIPIIANELGYLDKQECHEVLCFQFIPKIITVDNKQYKIPGRSSELTTKEFSDYIDSCKALAHSMGVYIPDAGEIPNDYAVGRVG